jgi:hypothetical protein
MNYNDLTWRHFMSAAHAGTLSGSGVRRGTAGSRSQGIWVQFDLQIGTQSASSQGVAHVQAARFLAYGCPHVIAVADWVAENSQGLEVPGSAAAASLQPAHLPLSVAALQREFEVPVEKLGRVLIIEDAWRAALSSPYGGESAYEPV